MVYTWVDGDWPGHEENRRAYATRAIDLNPERFRDPYSLLKYSLRSVERFAPWIERIHLVTQQPQVPPWLNLKHPQVNLVFHDQIFDSTDQLPSFHSNAIESYIHRVRTSSDYFLYFNDDCFLGSPVEPADLLSPSGQVRIMGSKRAESRIAAWLSRMIPDHRIEHAPVLIHRPQWEAMLQRHATEIARLRSHRFRPEGSDMLLWRAYREQLLSLPKDERVLVPAHQVTRLHRLHRIDNDFILQKRELDRVYRQRPKFFCLNDDQGAEPDRQVMELVRGFLNRYYPEPSRFEL